MSSILNLSQIQMVNRKVSMAAIWWKIQSGGSAVKSFLDGTSDVRAGHIINAMYSHQYSHPPSRHHEQLHQFSPDITPSNIKYAGPAISSWPCNSFRHNKAGRNYLCSRKANLWVCASRQTNYGKVGVTHFTWLLLESMLTMSIA